MDFPLYFQKLMLLWQRSVVEIDYGFFRVFGTYFIGKSLGTFKILIFGVWSFISHPYMREFRGSTVGGGNVVKPPLTLLLEDAKTQGFSSYCNAYHFKYLFGDKELLARQVGIQQGSGGYVFRRYYRASPENFSL